MGNNSTGQPVAIATLQIENVKRAVAVYMEPRESGLTIIGGDNCSGKTSVIDAIVHALRGDKYKPDNPIHAGAERGETTITLSNGVVVRRTYTEKGSYLAVTDPSGKKHGQALLNDLTSELALNLGGFVNDTDRGRAATLLQVIGVDLQPYEERLRKLEQDRLLKGRERDTKKGHAQELPFHEDVGNTPLDGRDMVRKMQDALAHNARIQEAHREADAIARKRDTAASAIAQRKAAVESARAALAAAEASLKAAEAEHNELVAKAGLARQAAEKGTQIDTTVIERKVEELEALNAKIRDNRDREAAFAAAEALGEEYRALTTQIEEVRAERQALLDAHPLPLPGLEIADGALLYNGQTWDGMSGAERLIVATAVCHLINPRCRFVLIDGLEAMDKRTLREFCVWLESRNLQAIGTRVSDGDECSIIIEDGIGSLKRPEPEAEPEEVPDFGD